MAKKDAEIEVKPETVSIDEMTTEELQQRILRTQLKREYVLLEKSELEMKQLEEYKADRSRRNAMRMQELAEVAAAEANVQRQCRHRQGGFRHNLLRGDGKPTVTRYTMLDGFTEFLQCSRCRIKVFTPHPDLERENPKEYAKQKALFDKMMALHEESGLDGIKGPTWMFMKHGVPFIPKRV